MIIKCTRCCVVFALCLLQFCTLAYTGQDSLMDHLAPVSRVKEDSPQMALMAIVASVWSKIQRGDILLGDDGKSQIWSALSAELKMQSAFVQESIELDKGLPMLITKRPDGSMALDVMAWIQQKPKRVACVNSKCIFLSPKLPPLLDRVHARGGRLLEQEIPIGPLKTFLTIVREKGWNNVMVFGGSVRNLLLEREGVAGDLDVIIWAQLSDDEKKITVSAKDKQAELRSRKFKETQSQIQTYFGTPLREIKIDGSPLQIIGMLDENLVFYGEFARNFKEPLKEIPGLTIDVMGILPQNLRIFNPVGGLEDLTKKTLRFAGRDIENGITQRDVFRLLRLKSQLASWGLQLDGRTSRLLSSAFRSPPTEIFQLMMNWAHWAVNLKQKYPDVEHDIGEIRKLRKVSARLKADIAVIQQKGGDAGPQSKKLEEAENDRDWRIRYLGLVLAQYEIGEDKKITDQIVENKIKNGDVDRLIRTTLVEIDLELGEVEQDTDKFGIGKYILELYQGAADPEGITAELHRLGADLLLKAIGIDLIPFTGYARRVWVEDRLKEARFNKSTAITMGMDEYRMGDHVVRVPLKSVTDTDELVASHGMAINILGDSIPPTTMLRNVRVRKEHIIDLGFYQRVNFLDKGDEIEIPLVIVQDLVGVSLPDYAFWLEANGDKAGMIRLMKNFLKLQVSLWSKSVISLDYQMQSYVVQPNGEVLLSHLESLRNLKHKEDHSLHLDRIRAEAETFFNLFGKKLGTRFAERARRVISNSVLQEILSRPFLPQKHVEDAHWARAGRDADISSADQLLSEAM